MVLLGLSCLCTGLIAILAMHIPGDTRSDGAYRLTRIMAVSGGACEETGLKPRVLFGPVRVAISGRTVAPGLFESLVLLGRQESLARIATLGRRFAVEG